MPPRTLLLASTSPRRSMLLGELGVPFRVVPGNAEEVSPEHLTPAEMCQVNAHRKAMVIARQHPDDVVLGADTLVFLGTRVYGKPASMEDARRMIGELQGRTHHVITGVCLAHVAANRIEVFSEITSVTFRALTEAEIDAYLALIQPLDKAGAYAIQDHGDRIVETIQGSHSNVVGLPLEALGRRLPAFLNAASGSA